MRLSAALLSGLLFASGAEAQQAKSTRDILRAELKLGVAACPSNITSTDVLPAYPAASRRAREEGTVVVGVCISPEGVAETVEVLSGPRIERLDLATALWACGRHYEPARDPRGRPVRTCAMVAEYPWRLKDVPPLVEDMPLAVQVRSGQ